MKNKIICLVLSLVLVSGLLCANGTYAWFMTFSGAGSDAQSLHNLSSGNIGVSIAGGFKDFSGNRIQPEVELLADLSDELKAAIGVTEETDNKLYIKSTSAAAGDEDVVVETDVRIKITYTYFENSVLTHDILYTGEAESAFVAEAAEGWTFNTEDNYFYCDSSLPSVTGTNAAYLPIFTSLRYSGENSDFPANLYDGETEFKVTVTFEAKQADFAEWTDIGSFEMVAD